MSRSLEETLALNKKALRDGLAEAEAELAALREREAHLKSLIAQANAALGIAEIDRDGGGEGRLTLHKALERVLLDNENRWMTVRELADVVNSRGLYTKRDGTPVDPNQVHARTKNYAEMFEKDGSRVRLRISAHDWSVEIFRDDDDGFHAWLDDHPGGAFVNTQRNPKPDYLVMHLPICPHFDRSPNSKWTKDYIKVCSDNRDELVGWAAESVGGEITLCKSCFG